MSLVERDWPADSECPDRFSTAAPGRERGGHLQNVGHVTFYATSRPNESRRRTRDISPEELGNLLPHGFTRPGRRVSRGSRDFWSRSVKIPTCTTGILRRICPAQGFSGKLGISGKNENCPSMTSLYLGRASCCVEFKISISLCHVCGN